MILEIIGTTSFWYAVLRVSTPIIFASLAAIVSNKAGVVNIGIEGTMLISSLIGVLISAFTQNVLVGVLAGILAGVLAALILAYCALHLKTDITLTGIALNLFASGGTIFLLYLVTGDKGMSGSLKSLVVPTVHIPVIKDIPVLGEIISGHNLLTYLAFLCVFLTFVLLYKLPVGLRIRAVGESEGAVASVGLNVIRIRCIALILSGIFSGLGGIFMSMGYVSWFSKDMIAGRGFIALAAEAMGRGTPLGTLIASIVFGFADALSNYLQSLQVPAELVMMIPYVTTVVGLLIYSIKRNSKNKFKKEGKNESKINSYVN